MLAFVTVGPEMAAGRGIDQLGSDAYAHAAVLFARAVRVTEEARRPDARYRTVKAADRLASPPGRGLKAGHHYPPLTALATSAALN